MPSAESDVEKHHYQEADGGPRGGFLLGAVAMRLGNDLVMDDVEHCARREGEAPGEQSHEC